MHLPITHELSIAFSGADPQAVKEHVKTWLAQNGEETFVEGVLDGIDVDFEYGLDDRDYYGELGGALAPIIIYKYDNEYLLALRARMEAAFGSTISCSSSSMDSKVWQEGWKESFQPITTKLFHVFPPWRPGEAPTGRIPLEIEPGMAFGTGQHATTQLCLSALEDLSVGKRLLDVGTGSGILAIAAVKAGWGSVVATDIDPDGIIAATRNAAANHVNISLCSGTFPQSELEGGFDCVVANILAVVLLRLLPGLAAQVQRGGILVLSGLLVTDEQEIQAALVPLSLEIESSKHQDDWSALVIRKV